MKKRLICLSLAICLLVSMLAGISVSATPFNDDIYSKAELLTILGIIEEIPEEAELKNQVTRRDFAISTAKMLGIDVYEITPNRYYQDLSESDICWTATAKLLEQGVLTMNNTRTFRPDDIITRDEAACMMMKALGLTGFDYETTLLMAKRSEVLSNIPYGKLTYADTIRILHNTLNSPVYNYAGATSQHFMVEPGGDTFLEVYYDISYAEGIVTSVNETSVERVSGVGEGTICVGETIINVSISDPYQYLGSYAGAYYRDINGRFELVYIMVKENKTERTVVNADDFADFDKNTYEVSFFEGSRERKVALDKSVTVIKNGENTSKDISTVFDNIINGEIILIDADGVGECETVIINSYVNLVVSYVDTEKGIIYGTNNEVIDLSDGNKTSIIVAPDGTAKKISEISPENTISRFSSEKLERLVVSTNMVSGEITSVSSRNKTVTVTIGGMKYPVDKVFAETKSDMIKTGRTVTAYIDANGKIADMLIGSIKGGMYAYIVDLRHEDGLNEAMYIMLYTEKGELISMPLNKKVKIDGEICKTEAEIKTALSVATGNYAGQLAVVYLNGDSTQVNSIDTTAEGSQPNGLFITSPNATYPFFSGQMLLGPLMHLNASSKLFIVPASEKYKNDINAYQVVKGNTFFKDWENYSVEGYSMGDSNEPKYTEAMLYKTDLLGTDGMTVSHINVFIVEDVSQVYDEEKEEITEQLDLLSGKTKLSFYGAENINLTEHPYVEKGNVVKIKTNAKNQIAEISLIYGKMKNGTVVADSNSNIATSWSTKDSYAIGYVSSLKNGLVGISAEKDMAPFLIGALSGKPVGVYDPQMTESVFSGGESDLIDAMNMGYKVIVDISRGNIRSYSVIKADYQN